MLPLALGLGGLFLLLGAGGAKAAKPRRLPAPPLRAIAPGGKVLTTPKEAPKTYDVEIGPITIKKPPKPVTANPGLGTSLTEPPSQGGSPPLDPGMAADMKGERYVPIVTIPAARPSSPPPRSQSPGVNLDAARRGSTALAAHLKRSGKANYDRRMLKTWQGQAGLTADGLYGAASRAKLVSFGVKDPPPAFY
jgi:peptidoglycan hydrolase-like protein with peptidoglycan-binding domain